MLRISTIKVNLLSLWHYRNFIFSSVKREFQVKYRNSILGALWAILHPLSLILVYTIIFSQLMQARLPEVNNTFAYSIYLCAGILSWGLFTEISTRSQTMFLDNANLLKKLSFPRICLPVIVILGALLNFSIIFSLFVIFLLVSQSFPGWEFIALLPLYFILIAMAMGLGLILGVLNVFFRDVGQLFTLVITFWFWLTPIVYPLNILPEKIQLLLQINPLTGLITGMQSILVQGEYPQMISLVYPLLVTCALVWLGIRLFRKHSADLVDEL